MNGGLMPETTIEDVRGRNGEGLTLQVLKDDGEGRREGQQCEERGVYGMFGRQEGYKDGQAAGRQVRKQVGVEVCLQG